MIIGIDIGGTEIKYGLVNEKGEILSSSSVTTEASKGVEILLEKIDKIVTELRDERTLGVGISATGQIDNRTGKVMGGADIIPGWIGTGLVEILEKRYGLPITLDNDVNCAALGEMWLGAGKDKKDFLMLAIGTGIGGGIVLNGELLRGESNIAGEFGHMPLIKNGIQCACGGKGCYERYASTSALVQMVEKNLNILKNGKEIFEEIHAGNKEFIEVFDIWCDYLTDGLVTLIYTFNPKLIIIGGGISKQGEFLKEKIFESLVKKIPQIYTRNLEIKMATKGNDAGVLGAAYTLLKKIKKGD